MFRNFETASRLKLKNQDPCHEQDPGFFIRLLKFSEINPFWQINRSSYGIP
jgi:hypothetical protein